MRLHRGGRLTWCMDDGDGDERLPLVGARLPGWCTRREVSVEPGEAHPFAAHDWIDALVVVERGEIVLVGVSGSRLLLGPGAVFVLDGVDLCSLHNPGTEPAVLVAVSRTRPAPTGDT
jgi:hypothetical protein